MKHRIEHNQPWWRSGADIQITLSFTDEEHRLIRKNNMQAVTIVEMEPQIQTIIDRKSGKKEKVEIDHNIYFKDLYGRRTSYHCDSVLEANDLHKKLFEGLKQFEIYLEANKSPVEDTEGDLKIKVPAFSVDLIPDYMWPQHLYVMAESGGGKTQLLQTIYVQQMAKPKPPGFIIIDSQGQMLHIIKSRFPDAVMIDPISNPISLDLFNPGSVDPTTVVDDFRYLFEAGQQPLTGRQTTAFMYAIILLVYGYPEAFGHTATIEDFEEYLIGKKKGKELPERAHRAVNCLKGDDNLKNWYLHQYAGFDTTHSEILQRLNNICGPYTPLRALFRKQHDTINLYDAIENGRTILVNTNYEKLGRYASAFFGRFLLKLIDRNIAHRGLKSHPMILVIDEAQEYFDGTIMKQYPDQARKRNVSCIWATQRLSNFGTDQSLRDALLGVGTLIASYVNDADVREVSNRFRVELDQVRAWRPQYRKEGKPTYADFGYRFKGRHQADTFRLKYGQLEDLPKKASRTEEARAKADGERSKDHPNQEAPINDDVFDPRYDTEEQMTISPARAKTGFVLTVNCPSRRSRTHPIPEGTLESFRFCIKGESGVRRPDGKFGNHWVDVTIPRPQQSSQESEEPQQRKKGR